MHLHINFWTLVRVIGYLSLVSFLILWLYLWVKGVFKGTKTPQPADRS